MRLGVGGVELDRTAEMRDRLAETFDGALVPKKAPFQAGLVRFDARGRRGLERQILGAGERRFERGGDASRDLGFHLENVRQFSIVGFRPEVGVALGMDELNGHAHRLA